ncbi:hypothetical protein FACS189429_0310 [Bacteroidia bacterium]|nr:hypothetical protein FACS189429_0310 [Bacteroidia bacterium]
MLTSCATSFNKKDYTISILSDLPNSSVIINDANNCKLPTKAVVTRSKENLNFKILQNDSVINDTILKPKLSDMFWWGNTGLFLYLAPFAWAVDLTNNKRFTYGEYLYIDSLGNVESRKKLHKYFSDKYAEYYFHKYKKGNVNLLLSIPEVNLFHLNPKNETTRNSGGFIGLGIGAEYFYKNNKSLQLRGDAIMDFIAPVPAPFDWEKSQPRENCYAFNVSLTDNFQYKRFQFGYGLNFAKNIWVSHAYYIKPSKDEIIDENYEYEWIDGKAKANTMLGLAFNTYYRVTDHFYFGVIYRPSLWEVKINKIIYERTISFDFMWKINLYRTLPNVEK